MSIIISSRPPRRLPLPASLVKIDTDDEGGKLSRRENAGACRGGWLAPRRPKKGSPQFSRRTFDTSETSQSTLGSAQPLRLESILSPKMSTNSFFLICFINPPHFHNDLKCSHVLWGLSRAILHIQISFLSFDFFVNRWISFFLPFIDRELRLNTPVTFTPSTCFLQPPQPILLACMKHISHTWHFL